MVGYDFYYCNWINNFRPLAMLQDPSEWRQTPLGEPLPSAFAYKKFKLGIALHF